jgi:hypothetical protein
MSSADSHNDYDLEAVKYCSSCYSLKIKYDESIDDDYCVDCGCTDISEAPIERWEQLYQGRYGCKFTQKSNNIKESFIYKMTIQELKGFLLDNNIWKDAISKFYPRFPGGLSRADSIILFFDQIVKDKKLDELKEFVISKTKK